MFDCVSIRHALLISIASLIAGCQTSPVGSVVSGLTVGAVLDKADNVVQNAIETADSRVAREQGIFFSGVAGTIDRMREAYRSELNRTVESLSRIEQATFRDLNGTINELSNEIDDVDKSLDKRIEQMQSAMNQVLTRLPLTKKDPVLLTVAAHPSPPPGEPDVTIYGYLLGNDLDRRLKPAIKLNGIDIPSTSVRVDQNKVEIVLPADIEQRVKALFSPCDNNREIAIEGDFKYRTGGFLGMGRRIKTVSLARTIALPESLYLQAVVEYHPLASEGPSAPIRFFKESPTPVVTGNPGMWSGSACRTSDLALQLPDAARNISVTNWGWHAFSGSAHRRSEVDSPVVAGNQVSIKGKVCSERRHDGRVWARLFFEGTYTVTETISTDVPKQEFPRLSFLRGRSEFTISSPANLAAKPKVLAVNLLREGCSEPVDTARLVATADGSGTITSEKGGFQVKVLGGAATIGLAPR